MSEAICSCEAFLMPAGPAFESHVEGYRCGFGAQLAAMREVLSAHGPLARVPAFADYERYCRWPIRMLEYGFAMRSTPDPVGHALDVGSGVTPWPYWLAARGWSTTAVDILPEEVAAMARFGAETYGATVVHRMADARGLAFADDTFEVVTSISVLEHIPQADVALAISELVRVTRCGGRFVLTTDLLACDTPFTKAESFTVEAFERIFGPLAEGCGAAAAFAELVARARSTTHEAIGQFWQSHKPCGLWDEDNRGYYAVGLSLRLPSEPSAKAALARTLADVAARWPFPPPDDAGDFRQIDVAGDAPLWLHRDPLLEEALAGGLFEAEVSAFFARYMRAGDIVFDVGANVGHYTRSLAVQCGAAQGGAGRVHAFEPSNRTFACLVRNTVAVSGVIRNRFGLSSESGPREIRLGVDGNEALNSFGEPFGAGAVANGTYTTECVWTMTLDAYVRAYKLARVDLIKVDVEGWEEHVVRGGVGVLLRHRPVLVLEYCSDAARNAMGSCRELSATLLDLGYRLYRYDDAAPALDPVDERRDAWQFANLVAVPDGRLAAVLDRLGLARPAPVAVAHVPAAPADAPLRAALELQAALRREAAGLLDTELAYVMRESNARRAYIGRLEALVQEQRCRIAQAETENVLVQDKRSRNIPSQAEEDARQALIAQLKDDLDSYQRHVSVRILKSLAERLRKGLRS